MLTFLCSMLTSNNAKEQAVLVEHPPRMYRTTVSGNSLFILFTHPLKPRSDDAQSRLELVPGEHLPRLDPVLFDRRHLLFGVERRQPLWTRPERSSQKHALAPLDLDVLESGDGSDMSWCAV